MPIVPTLLLSMLAALATAPALAVDVYRCADADGNVEYRDTPCAQGAGRKITIQSNVNVTSEIDQRAAREASKAIADRAAARAQADAIAAQQRAQTIPPPAPPPAYSTDYQWDLRWWQIPGPPPDRIRPPDPEDNPPPNRPTRPPPSLPVRPMPMPGR